MVQHRLLPQANHRWRPYDIEQSSFDRRSPSESPSSWSGKPSSSSVMVGKGSYSIVNPAQTTVPTSMPTAPRADQGPQSITTTAVPHHHHRRLSEYMLPTTLAAATVNRTSGVFPTLSQSARAATVVATEPLSSSWIFESAPPPHARSLYATIPLPVDDNPGGSETHPPHGDARRSRDSLEWPSSSSRTTPSQANPNPHHFPSNLDPYDSFHQQRPIELHPFLNSACVSRTPPSTHALSRSPHSSSRPANWARVRDAPATAPSVGHLTLVIDSTGQTFCVRPTSPTNPHIVTVGGVLEALETAAVSVDSVCRGRCGSPGGFAPTCFGGRLSVTLNCLQLWWRTPDGANRGLHPWQVVVRSR